MIIIIADVDEVAALLDMDEARQPEIVRPQTSGPCVHYDEQTEYAADADPCTYPYDAGQCPHLDNPDVLCPVKDACATMHEVARMRDKCETEQEEQVSSLCGYYDERSEHADNIDPCTHPDACKTGCPYLDDDGIYCPQKDGWSAASKQAEEDLAWAWGDDIPKFVPLAQDPEGGGTDMVAEAPDTIPRSDYVPAPEDPGRLHTYVVEPEPEFPEPAPEEEPVYEAPPPVGEMRLDARGWTPEEERALRGATTPAEAVALYRAAYPGSSRTDAAIKSRYHQKIRPRRHGADGPLPDFAGDTVPVTQCEEPASKGLYGDARALHADMMDGMMCDRPIDACEPIVRGDRVALVDDSERVGTAVIVNVRSKFASVEFPDDDGPARVYPLSALRRVIA